MGINLDKNLKIYLDTCVYIYFFEGNKKYHQACAYYFDQIIQQSIPVFASTLLTTELLTLPLMKKNKTVTKLYKNLTSHIPSLRIKNFDNNTAINTAQLRAKHNIKTPDAIHLATAIENKCDYFITADKNLPKLRKPKIIKL